MRCQATKNDGEQCSRETEPKSKYCWQHQPDYEEKGGRKKEYETPEEMQKAINEYFESCFITDVNDQGEEYQKRIRPWTISGLAVALGVTRQTILNYQNEYDHGFFDTIRRAKAKIEMYAEEQLFRGQGKTSGVQFNLKNNFKWEDKRDISMEVDKLPDINLVRGDNNGHEGD